jgi:hypothetical protein
MVARAIFDGVLDRATLPTELLDALAPLIAEMKALQEA